MMLRSMITTAAVTALAVGLRAAAQDDISPGMQTGWLELVKGHIGDGVGAEIRDVRRDPESGERHVMVAIPKAALLDNRAIEEVRVIGRAPDRVEINLPDFETEWVDDYDNDFYGLLLRLKDGPETPVRLFLSTRGGVLDNSVNPQP